MTIRYASSQGTPGKLSASFVTPSHANLFDGMEIFEFCHWVCLLCDPSPRRHCDNNDMATIYHVHVSGDKRFAHEPDESVFANISVVKESFAQMVTC
eukprot:scaffold88126_cov38-Prasinocladus_malaysianus.AAC.2